MSQTSDKSWRPETLEECTDFWRLHLWVRQHPGQWSLEQVYARMVELNEGPPTDDDLAMSTRLSDPWLKGSASCVWLNCAATWPSTMTSRT